MIIKIQIMQVVLLIQQARTFHGYYESIFILRCYAVHFKPIMQEKKPTIFGWTCESKQYLFLKGLHRALIDYSGRYLCSYSLFSRDLAEANTEVRQPDLWLGPC